MTDPLALGREVILFESAGVGRSTGEVPDWVRGMADHALAFVDALGLAQVDLPGITPTHHDEVNPDLIAFLKRVS